jgi:small GTP-binding protein
MSHNHRPIKVVMVGNCGTGKTTLCKHFLAERHSDEPEPTIGCDYVLKEIQHASYGKIMFNVWDTAGAEKFNSISMTQTYYRKAEGVIYLFDLTCRDSFNAVRDVWLKRIQSATTIYSHFCAVLVGNKSDLEARRVVRVDEALALARELGVNYVELSSTRSTYADVRQPFMMIATELLDSPTGEACSVYDAQAVRDAIQLGGDSSYAYTRGDTEEELDEGHCC